MDFIDAGVACIIERFISYKGHNPKKCKVMYSGIKSDKMAQILKNENTASLLSADLACGKLMFIAYNWIKISAKSLFSSPEPKAMSKNIAARGRGLFSLYICIENFKNLLVRNH